MIGKTFFITGTDTDAGKSYISKAILDSAIRSGYSTAVLKPVAAGAIGSDLELERVSMRNGELKNDDALLLQQACTLPLSYQEINPFCLKQAIAPHIAAELEGVELSVKELRERCKVIIDKGADLTLIEGAGGWLVPLNKSEFISDLVIALKIPVVLVVGMRLGCLNHALLTVRALEQDGVEIHGWIANQIDPEMPVYQENIDTLKLHIRAPHLATVPWSGNSKEVQPGIIEIENFI